MAEEVYFQVETPLGVLVRTTKEYWIKIASIKHPSIEPFEKEVKQALKEPSQVRKSKQDTKVHLYYKNIGKLFICVVANHINSEEGYVITAYLTDRIKEGEQVYVKN